MPNASFDSEELFALARLDIEQGALADALAKLKALVAKTPPLPEATVMIARVYARLGLLEKAQEHYREYVELNPKAFHEIFELGMTYFDKGQIDEAMSFWDKVLQADPTHPPALFYCSLAFARTGKVVDARRNLDVLLKSAPSDNLYFDKAKELMRDMDNGVAPKQAFSDTSPQVSPGAGPAPYGRQ